MQILNFNLHKIAVDAAISVTLKATYNGDRFAS